MPRVKRGTMHVKRRRNLLSSVKGYRYGRKSKIKQAKEAQLHAGQHAYRDRRRKKRDFRRLWQVQLNAAARLNGLSYSQLIDRLHKKSVELNRKVLVEIAQKNPEAFSKIVEKVR